MLHLAAWRDAKRMRQTAVDFQNRKDVIAAHNRGFVMWDGIVMHMHDNARAIEKDHIKRDQGVFHPETHGLRMRIDKEHASAFGQGQDSTCTLLIPDQNKWLSYELGHNEMLTDAGVFKQLEAWL